MNIRQSVGLFLLGVFLVVPACKKSSPGETQGAAPSGGKAPAKGDALFLAEAPVMVPPEVLADFDGMGIGKIYVPGAALTAQGALKPFPPSPEKIARPVVLVLMGENGAEAQFRADAKGDEIANGWAPAIRKLLDDAKPWADVVGLHLHVLPAPAQAEVLAAVCKKLKGIARLPISVTLPADAPPESWKPLSGAADEALVFSYGRRPENANRVVTELPEATAKDFPLPFRILIVPGGYGFASKDGVSGRKMSDGDIDRLSEDRNLDFGFGEVLSSTPGNTYRFKPRQGYENNKTLLAADGGYASFQVLSHGDLLKFLAAVAKWPAPSFKGRVFMVDGLPSDGHLLGFPALRAILTGKPVDPKLVIETVPTGSGRGFAEFKLKVENQGDTPSDLSRFNNFIKVRVEGGVLQRVNAGDYDRYELLEKDVEKSPIAPFGRATVTHIYENFFAPREASIVGPIRVSGSRPRVFFSYQMTLGDGRAVKGEEIEVALAMPKPEPAKKAKGKK